MIAFHPSQAMTMIRGIWRYLRKHSSMALVYGKVDYSMVHVYTDASFAPGGDRSRDGVVIYWRGGLVFWYSKKQHLATLSTPESELGGCIPGIKFGIGINDLRNQLNEEADEGKSKNIFALEGDNMATLITISSECTTWRSRHYALRAGWARDQVSSRKLGVKHKPGKELPADALTKILSGPELSKARERLLLGQIPTKTLAAAAAA